MGKVHAALIGGVFPLMKGVQSSRRRRLTASSHTTGHAGPHPAVHREWRRASCARGSSVSCRGCSALCTIPTGFTRFACTVVPLYRGRRPFVFIPRTARRTTLLDVQPFPKKTSVLWPRLTPVISIWHYYQTYLLAG